jgi:hypothetical protein
VRLWWRRAILQRYSRDSFRTARNLLTTRASIDIALIVIGLLADLARSALVTTNDLGIIHPRPRRLCDRDDLFVGTKRYNTAK